MKPLNDESINMGFDKKKWDNYVGQSVSNPLCNTSGMICRKKQFSVGDSVRVQNCWGGYSLPHELPEGATVLVVAREVGQAHVEFQEKRFIVALACVDSGWEYKLHGKWLDENHPSLLTIERTGKGQQLRAAAGY